jgi:hypothetical protein
MSAMEESCRKERRQWRETGARSALSALPNPYRERANALYQLK